MPDSHHQIGPYRILGEIGEGGMGTVFVAEQREPVRRRVALKLIKGGMDTKQVLARFEQERQALAVMSHEAIAKVFDAGATDQGQPYFVMELVEGLPITQFCDQYKLSIPARIELFRKVCAGVQHAHQKGVMHRDLKPGNVLVTLKDDDPLPKIIDFGLARATDQRLVEETIYTEQGQLIGTPEYMSPEQARGKAEQIDTRTDVYSLGVMLYELLTGELPFSSLELRAAGLAEIVRTISEEEPPKPSTRISSFDAPSREARAKQRELRPQGLRKVFQGDLDWIVMRALEKTPDRRYDTPLGIALDLRRYVEDEPVEAGPPTFAYRFSKFVRKHRTQVVSAAIVVLALAAGLTASLVFASRARNAERIADDRASDLEEKSAALEQSSIDLSRSQSRYRLLRGVVIHQRAKATTQSLVPAWPETISAIDEWLDGDVATLQGLLPDISRALSDLAGGSQSEGGLVTPPVSERPPTRAIEESGESRRFLIETLTRLERDIRGLLENEVPDVRKRRDWARQIKGLTRDHPRAGATWSEVADALALADGKAASELYREAFSSPVAPRLEPQLGLVPIGRNPTTKLWEFYHLRSAWDGNSDPRSLPIPRHGKGGRISMRKGTGIVFVLLPGGVFSLGAQPDPDQPNYDPDARGNEAPVARVPLQPFFMARHELTQAQWSRLCSGDVLSAPSLYAMGKRTLGVYVQGTNPVEQVDWRTCNDLARLHGLDLPTEAQWEYACRAGSSSAWFSGGEPESLAGFANVLDKTARSQAPKWGLPESEFDDGYSIHAPAGTFSPNPFGLHDTHGNVWEWCRDHLDSYYSPLTGPGSMRSPRPNVQERVVRGGSFLNPVSIARSGFRNSYRLDYRKESISVRLSRRLIR